MHRPSASSFGIGLILGLLLNAPAPTFAALDTRELHTEVKITIQLKYLIWLPEGYALPQNRSTQYPCILFLHGAEKRGTNINALQDLGPLKYARTHPQAFPFIVVAPLCPPGRQWEPLALLTLLDEIQRQYRINQHAIYLTGYSMGGAGTWATAMAAPDRFAAIAPLCGRVIPLLAGNLYRTPVWVFHGEKDQVVPLNHSTEMVDILKNRNNPHVKFSLLPGKDHEIWHDIYDNSALYSWFMEHRRP